MRGERISGGFFNGWKFRLKTLGFTEERLLKLDIALNKSKELNRTRDNENYPKYLKRK